VLTRTLPSDFGIAPHAFSRERVTPVDDQGFGVGPLQAVNAKGFLYRHVLLDGGTVRFHDHGVDVFQEDFLCRLAEESTLQCRSLNRAGVTLAEHPRHRILHRTDDRDAAGQGRPPDHHHVHTERSCSVEFRLG